MSDLRSLNTVLRKERFKQTMLPLILRSNEDIMRQRKALLKAIDTEDNGMLRVFSKRYRVSNGLIGKKGWTDELLRRVAQFPFRLRWLKPQSNLDGGNPDLLWKVMRFMVSGSGMTSWA